jgi:hypothetical protein
MGISLFWNSCAEAELREAINVPGGFPSAKKLPKLTKE